MNRHYVVGGKRKELHAAKRPHGNMGHNAAYNLLERITFVIMLCINRKSGIVSFKVCISCSFRLQDFVRLPIYQHVNLSFSDLVCTGGIATKETRIRQYRG